MKFKAYLLDIEGTTTPIDFVTRTLFPFARARLDQVELTESEARLLAVEREEDQRTGAMPPQLVAPYLSWLMDQDRKSTGLKSVQGRIWESGYKDGELRGELYPDVLPAMKRWRMAGSKVAIFSSGSVHAQKLLFGHSVEGDLTGLIDGYFDTTTGGKREPESYVRIAESLKIKPSEICFLSDIIEEVDAAKLAGFHSFQVCRDDSITTTVLQITKFDSDCLV
ncbi:MAG: acireductone synthase [Armatimonadetes bacterium]|nr:acireductone synthase [Armatimonadota bacterium]